MSNAANSRRLAAEIDFDDPESSPRIGNRSLHQFWHLFSPHFKNVLLPPQRRPDSNRVAWTWSEPAENRPVTALELADVRRRLTHAQESLDTGVANTRAPFGAPESLDQQAREKMNEIVARLIDERDSTLDQFACRTESGVMLHSWGAAEAAKAYHPDAIVGEISGTVWVNRARAAGVTVVLENSQGGVLARITSDAAGIFSFSEIKPGNYRVRVASRPDFPADGVAVAFERESITGIELHDRPVDAEPVSPDAAIETLPVAVRRNRHGWLLVLIGLVLAAAGWFFWRSNNRSARVETAASVSSGWQSARGEPNALRGETNEPSVRKISADEGWSKLSNSLPAPEKIMTTGKTATEGGSEASPPPSAGVMSTDSGHAAAALHSSDGQHADQAFVAPRRPNPISAKAPVPPAETESEGAKDSEEVSERNKLPVDAPAKEDGNSRPALKSSPGKSAAVTAAVPTSAVDSSLESDAGEDSESARDSSSARATGVAKGKSAQRAAKVRAPTSGAAAEASDPEGSAEPWAGGASTASDASTTLSENLAAKSGAKAKALSPGSKAGTSVTASNENTSEISLVDDETEIPVALKKDFTKNSPAVRKPAPAAGEVDPAPPDEEPVANDSSDALEAAGKTPQDENPNKVPTRATAAKRPAGHANSPADAESPEGAAAEPQAVPAESASSSSPRRPKTARASGVTTHSPERSQALPETAEMAAEGEAASVTFYWAIAESDSSTPVGVRVSAWRPRLLRDHILPTQPMPEGEDDALETLRAELGRDQLAQRPSYFRNVVVSRGIAVKLAPGRAAAERLQWKSAAGDSLPAASVAPERAEITLPPRMEKGVLEYVLSDVNGFEVVRITRSLDGAYRVTLAKGVMVSYWMGIESPALAFAATEMPPHWRLLSGAKLPVSWLPGERWPGGAGQRLELPVDDGAATKRAYPIALVDERSGWALTSTLELR